MGRYPYPPIPQDKLLLLLQNKISNPEETLGLQFASSLSIFELLDYIVNDDPPRLPKGYFSDAICDFVAQCLYKHPAERADLDTLLKNDFITSHREYDISQWIKSVVNTKT